MEPTPPEVEVRSLNRWTTGKVPVFCVLNENVGTSLSVQQRLRLRASTAGGEG